ncbi:MAG: chemotaxis protein, partial [Flavipsychrobacter sp.]|nr:chemotaxis protein [Flavipsychrobacter sp.]
ILKNVVIPSLFNDKASGDTVKVWAVACSSGEEAYSLAMLLHEYADANNKQNINVKVFATDIDTSMINIASKGFYPETIAKDVSPERLKQFFIKEGNNYRIIPEMRKMVVFAKHDISKDPPFSRLDLLVCRNMLIYMNPVLQKNVLQKFHFSLNDGGFLFLGPSENIGTLKDVMKEIDKKWKIYKCISKEKSGEHEVFLNPVQRGTYVHIPASSKSKNSLNNIAEIFKETLLEEYDYAGIYIDKEFEVKQAIGNFKKYISFPEDNFNFNLLKLVPKDLSIALSTCIRKAMKTGKKVMQKKIKVTYGKLQKNINILVKPYLEQDVYLQPFVFIVFSEEVAEIKVTTIARSDEAYVSQRIEDLERELSDTKENLQAVIEEVESANEELQSSNEEIISSNEELQSTNEELQSLNEELHTVNAEHQLKIKELVELNDDMNNYFRNTEIGQILIDKKLIIRKFTPVVTKQINLISSDIGRSITDISLNFKNLDFINAIKGVIRTGQQMERELLMENGEVYLMRIVPYVRLDKALDGVVINFINITEARRLNTLVEAVFNSSISGIAAQQFTRDKNNKITDLEIITANESFGKILDTDAKTLAGRSMRDVFPDFMIANFDKCIGVLEGDGYCRFEYYDVKKEIWFEVVIVKMLDGIVSTFNDITEKKHSYSELKSTSDMLVTSNLQLEQSNYDLLQFASVASHDLKEPLRKIQTFGNKLKDKVEDRLAENELNYLDKIINASNRMQTLIEDILMLAKLSNSEIIKSKVDLNDILQRIEDDLEIVLKEKNVRINIGKLPAVNAISGQIHQLFQNLILNAIKFNENDPPTINISSGKVDEACVKELDIDTSKYFCITVSDNGIGFDQEYSEKIFGIFQRLNGSNYQGTGIGLAICKKIVDNHNGIILAESKLNEGAKFTILLPKE